MSLCCRKDQLLSGITQQKITSGWWITVPENQVLLITIYRGEMSRCFRQLCGTAYHRGIIPYLDRVINVCAIALRYYGGFYSVASLQVWGCLRARTPIRDFQEPKKMKQSSLLLERPRSRLHRRYRTIWEEIFYVVFSRGRTSSRTAKQSRSPGQILQ